MPKTKYENPNALKELLAEKQRALILYKTGLPLRKVGKLINRSHEWVRLAVNELEKVPSK